MEKDQQDRRLGDFPLSAQESPASLPSSPLRSRESRTAALKFLFSLSLQLARAHGFPPNVNIPADYIYSGSRRIAGNNNGTWKEFYSLLAMNYSNGPRYRHELEIHVYSHFFKQTERERDDTIVQVVA